MLVLDKFTCARSDWQIVAASACGNNNEWPLKQNEKRGKKKKNPYKQCKEQQQKENKKT